MLLLIDNKVDARDLISAIDSSMSNNETNFNHSKVSSTSTSFSFPLFEAMVKALDQNPIKIDHIARLIKDLQQLPPDEQLLPDNFDEIWQPIYDVYQKLKQ
ncbi:hypothetical protein LC613_37535 [Nostoc sphaeroides CHAB 2801]|uniref:hypothetical protein n=1 Tax=Nostoc sphaeroides TaxID=446679 RepID=UPI001E2FE9E4|nr:hypothetical protein [Nostoc sphaeroides]MCC5633206.1 hypothetical protein [Nostoc sphaeroides CHAB 2801]